jgi:NDMA-dependent alcohol dehydrogenase
MKAAILRETNKPLSIEEVELDPPKANEVRVKIAAAGVCRSDLHFMKGEAAIAMPAVLGHEGSAIVIEIGEGVTRVAPGDHVILSFVPFCGHCRSCLSGHANLCDTHAATGPSMFDGTKRLHVGTEYLSHMGKVACFAEEAVVPETGCAKVDPSLSLAAAALIGCSVTTGVGSVLFNAKIEPGSTVAVIGCGGVGLNILQGARVAGATKIIAIDVNDAALEFAGRFGATHTINGRQADVVKRVKELTDGAGADYAFESFGSSETVTTAFDSVRKGGTAVIVGISALGDHAQIDPVALVRQEKTLKGAYYGSSRPAIDFYRMVDLYQSGQIDVDGLVTRTYTLDQINQAYEELDRGVVGRGIIAFQ